MSDISSSNIIHLTKRRSKDGFGQERVLSICEVENIEFRILKNIQKRLYEFAKI